MIPNFKHKIFTQLTKEEKLAMTERVCMDTFVYFKATAPTTAGMSFVKYWMDNITKIEDPSDSPYMSHYLYIEGQGLCVIDGDEKIESVKMNSKETICFVQNVINPIPFRSPIVDRLMRGDGVEDLRATGVHTDLYGDTLPTMKGMKGIKKGKPKDPNSLAQKIKRGEITRYQAYQKKEFRDNDEAL